VLTALAVTALGAALGRPRQRHGVTGRWLAGRLERRRVQLERARVGLSPALFELLALGAPALGLVAGTALSPVVGLAALGAGLLLPSLLLSGLVARRKRDADGQALPLLQHLLANLGAGATYFDALQAARGGVGDRWLTEDLGEVVQQFLLDVPLEEALAQVRPRVAGADIGLVWDNLTVCVAQKLPADRARDLLGDVAATVRFNVQLRSDVRAQTAGQRAQVGILALVVPAMYIYMRVVSPDLLSVLDGTFAGKYILLPAAAALEVGGILVSLRVSRVRA
jgi:Flp pilus assembly protein TadB